MTDSFGKCPYYTSQKVLSGKWSIYLLHRLAQNPGVRFNELLRMMPGDMTHTTLTRQLKTLEADGLVVRTVYEQIPPKVEYSLSEIGNRFIPVLDVIGNWGTEYIHYLDENGINPANE